MRKGGVAALVLLALVVVTGCTPSTYSGSTGNRARQADTNKSAKLVDMTARGYESLPFSPLHNESTRFFFPNAYSCRLGWLAATPGFPLVKSIGGIPFQHGRIYVVSSHSYLPQMNPIPDYETFDLLSSGDWVCWIYQSIGQVEQLNSDQPTSGVGDQGERIYAYNTKTNKEYLVWKQDVNHLIIGFDLESGALYYCDECSSPTRATASIFRYQLASGKTSKILSSGGGPKDWIVEDFAVSENKLGVIETPANHFLPFGADPEEPYRFEMFSTTGKMLRVVYESRNVNPYFNLNASDGTWVWSDRTHGVLCYQMSKPDQIWNVNLTPSCVETYKGYVLWWDLIDNKAGAFDIRNEKYIDFSPYKNLCIFDSKVILEKDLTQYVWANVGRAK